MKIFLRIISVVFFLTAGLASLQAQWTKLNGPFYNGVATQFIFSGSHIVAGTSNGLFYSADHGKTWTQAYRGSPEFLKNPGLGWTGLVQSGGYLFAGSSYYGPFRSADDGVTWTSVTDNLLDEYGHSLGVREIASNGGEIFVCTAYQGYLYHSSDNGEHWTTVVIDSKAAANFDGMTVSDGNLFVWGYGKLLRSADNGSTWKSVAAGLNAGVVRKFTAIGSDLFCETDDGIFRSRDRGETWNGLDPGWPRKIFQYAYYGFYTSGEALFINAPGNGLFRSTDNGNTWEPVKDNHGNPLKDPASFAVMGTDLMMETPHRLFHSTDNGKSWDSVAVDFDACYVTTFVVSGPNYFVGTLEDGVLLSTDQGKSWRPIDSGLVDMKIGAIAVSGKNLFAAIPNFNGTVYRSTNNGGSWTDIGISALRVDGNLAAINGLVVSGTDLYALTMSLGIYRSDDNGSHWMYAGNGLPKNDYLRSFVVSRGVLLAAQDKGLYRSVNNGQNWYPVTTGLTGNASHISTLLVSGAQLFAVTLNGIYRSDDNGSHWTAVNTGLQGSFPSNCLCSRGGSVFAVNNSGDIYMTIDAGASWRKITDDLPVRYLGHSLAATGDALFLLGGKGGIWKRTLSDESDPTLMPTRVTLDQNYPNPFNPTTSIKFNLDSETFVSLKIYDALGRETATLASETLQAGTYVRYWNAVGYPSGMYLCRLQAGAFAETKRLLLLK